MRQILLQIQDVTGNWITVGSSMDQFQIITKDLARTASTFKRNARAVDQNGNIVQFELNDKKP
jgi:hypothetical protein